MKTNYKIIVELEVEMDVEDTTVNAPVDFIKEIITPINNIKSADFLRATVLCSKHYCNIAVEGRKLK